MPQYIDVFLDDEKRYYTNKGLREIIEYIGRQEHKNKGSLSSKKAYSLGKKSINSRLKKWHKKAIDRLVRAEKYKFKYNYNQVSGKPVWKIHKNKAKKIFKVIHQFLINYHNPDILLLFKKICANYGFLSGAEAAGNPYYKKIKDENRLKADKHIEKDINSLKSCANEIQKFSQFYKSN